MIEPRFIYRGNVIGLGGRIVKFDGRSGLNIPIAVQGASSLPVVGGVSVFKPTKCAIPYSSRSNQILVSARSVATSAESELERRGEPYVTRVKADIKSVRIIDSISIKRVVLDLTSTHKDGADIPQISLGNSEISGLKLSASAVDVKIDHETFQACDTKEALGAKFKQSEPFRRKKAKKFNTEAEAREIKEYKGGYYVCSIVESIEGKLPDGAYVDHDGYTIVWPGVGKIILGEMLVAQNSRRLTMVRVQLGCPVEGFAAVGEGEVNGSTLP